MQSGQMEKDNKQAIAISDETHLEFKVGPLHFCASALEVVAIISPPKMVHVPLSTDIIASCFNYHDETVTVLSMYSKFGLPLTRSENKTHIILARVDGGLKGFWVDQAIDIVPLENFEACDDYYPCEGKAYSNFLTRDKEIVLQTTFQRLYECNRSNLNWIAGIAASKNDELEDDASTDVGNITETEDAATSETADVDEAVSIEAIAASSTDKESVTEAEITATGETVADTTVSVGAGNTEAFDESDLSNKESMTGTEGHDRQSTAIDEVINESSLASSPESNNDESVSSPSSFNSANTNNTDVSGRNAASAASQPFSSTSGAQFRSNKNNASSLNKTENISASNTSGDRFAASNYNNKHVAGTRQPGSFGGATANNAYANARNAAKTSSQAYRASRPMEVNTYDSDAYNTYTEDNKNTGLFVMAAVLLLLLALALGSVYLIDGSTDSKTSRYAKEAASRNLYETREQVAVEESDYNPEPTTTDDYVAPEPPIETKSYIEPEPAEIAPSENQSLNEVAVEDESMPAPSENARVFELHVNERSDSERYAITSFEPVAAQQETAPEQESVLERQQFTHIVVKGDTLWHITRRYLDNPHRYPELAAASHITNPHRIYPGDIIKIIVNKAQSE